MNLFVFLLLGIIVGFVSRLVVPAARQVPIAWTLLLGVAGTYLGGSLASFLQDRRVLDLDTAGMIGGAVGGLALVFVASRVEARRTRTH